MTNDEKDEYVAKRMYEFSRSTIARNLEEPETWEALKRSFPEWVAYWKSKAKVARLALEEIK